MRVLFLEVDTERSWAVASIGPGFIAAYLRQHGHEVPALVGVHAARLQRLGEQPEARVHEGLAARHRTREVVVAAAVRDAAAQHALLLVEHDRPSGPRVAGTAPDAAPPRNVGERSVLKVRQNEGLAQMRFAQTLDAKSASRPAS